MLASDTAAWDAFTGSHFERDGMMWAPSGSSALTISMRRVESGSKTSVELSGSPRTLERRVIMPSRSTADPAHWDWGKLSPLCQQKLVMLRYPLKYLGLLAACGMFARVISFV